MDEKIITPEESLLIISKTIEETKKRFYNSGHIILFWGLLTFVVTLSQFILIKLEYYEINWYPNFLYPLGAIYTFIYGWSQTRKKNLPKTIIGTILASLGWIVGMNLMIMGFFFSHKLGEAIAPVFLVILAIMVFICGISVRYKPMIWGGILLNMMGLACFLIGWEYHPLIMSLGALVALVIPGLLLVMNKRKENV